MGVDRNRFDEVVRQGLSFVLRLALVLGGLVPNGFGADVVPTRSEEVTARSSQNFRFDDIVGSRILVLGDSISEAGGYLSDIRYYLAKRYPGKVVDFTNIGLSSEGISGYSPYERHEKIYGFPNPWILSRLDAALRKLKPEVVVMMYGMNDSYEEVYAQGEFPMYKNGFERVLIACREKGVKKFIILTPTPYGDFAAPKEKYLTDYSEWLLSRKDPDVVVVDLHGRFKVLVESRGESYAPDKVHPNAKYHFEMAKIILAAGGIEVSKEDNAESIARDPLWKTADALQRLQDDCTRRWVGYTREAVFSKPERYTEDEQKKRTALCEQLELLVSKASAGS